jgi:hypothetical protein
VADLNNAITVAACSKHAQNLRTIQAAVFEPAASTTSAPNKHDSWPAFHITAFSWRAAEESCETLLWVVLAMAAASQ